MLPDGASIKDAVLALAGNIFIILFIVRTIGAFGKKEWGELIINILAGVLIAGLVYSNETTITLLRNIWNTFLG